MSVSKTSFITVIEIEVYIHSIVICMYIYYTIIRNVLEIREVIYCLYILYLYITFSVCATLIVCVYLIDSYSLFCSLFGLEIVADHL